MDWKIFALFLSTLLASCESKGETSRHLNSTTSLGRFPFKTSKTTHPTHFSKNQPSNTIAFQKYAHNCTTFNPKTTQSRTISQKSHPFPSVNSKSTTLKQLNRPFSRSSQHPSKPISIISAGAS
jgi:hypothetical protein